MLIISFMPVIQSYDDLVAQNLPYLSSIPGKVLHLWQIGSIHVSIPGKDPYLNYIIFGNSIQSNLSELSGSTDSQNISSVTASYVNVYIQYIIDYHS